MSEWDDFDCFENDLDTFGDDVDTDWDCDQGDTSEFDDLEKELFNECGYEEYDENEASSDLIKAGLILGALEPGEIETPAPGSSVGSAAGLLFSWLVLMIVFLFLF
jgi:hypothetical protein